MNYLWNNFLHIWNISPSIESSIIEMLAEDDLLKINATFEIFTEIEEIIIKKQNDIDDHEKDPEWIAIKEHQLHVKKIINSHNFVISLSNIIKNVLMKKLIELNSDYNDTYTIINFDQIILEISNNPNGFDPKTFQDYGKIKLLQKVSNVAKHSLKVDIDLTSYHSSFKKNDELPYLGDFLHDKNIIPACFDFIRYIYK